MTCYRDNLPSTFIEVKDESKDSRVKGHGGRAIAQAISRRIPTAAARVHLGCAHVGFYDVQKCAGALFR
jgi:hypothetical protein